MSKPQVTIYWMRRDLRLEDNAALFYALKDEFPVQPVFIFDTDILDKLEDKDDARVSFIHQEVGRLSSELREKGCYLDVRYGSPLDVWHRLLEEYDVQRLYANKDYEPYARKRDRAIYDLLESKSIPFIGKKDQVIFEKNEVLKKDGTPYTVYTPYSKVWKEKLSDFYTTSYPSQDIDNWNKGAQPKIISLQEMGFTFPDISTPSRTLNEHIVKKYDTLRNFPAKEGTTQMSVHLRFGTVSIRKLVRRAIALNQKYLNELIWRDFYSSILWHFPKVATDNFHKKYDYIQWRNDEAEFKKWCDGQTGYPIVDAGMRELNATRYMHNRVRMIVASFLTKHLLIDWRWGEAYFARKLLDFDLASNNGGWQWAAGTGVDAAPYFRVFNPYLQTEKFDPKMVYIKKWIPELNTTNYPKPIVEHKMARQRAIERYKEGLELATT